MLDGSVSCLREGSEYRQPLFVCLECKRGVSTLLDGSVSRLLEGSEHRQPLLACLEFKGCVSSLLNGVYPAFSNEVNTDTRCSLV